MNLPFNNKHKDNFFEERASLLKCISDPNCLKILDVLAKDDKPCVSEITKAVDISISAVSHQLSKLKAMGIVDTKRTGQTICYSLTNSENSQLIKKFLEK